MAKVQVRYIVNDVDAAMAFYTKHPRNILAFMKICTLLQRLQCSHEVISVLF